MIPHGVPRFLRDLLLVLGIALGIVLGVTRWLAIPWAVAGSSMNPTLLDGDRVVVDLLSYRRRPPRPDEIALLDGPGGASVVKRVKEGPLPPGAVGLLTPLSPVDADEDWFLVAGDSPRNSLDSRKFGPVPRHRFRGRVVWRYWPPSRIGSIR